MNAVEIKSLTLQHPCHLPLFVNFDFSLPNNKWVSLLGASGVGKSTLLRVIAGLEKDSIKQGSVVFSTKHINQQQKISYMAQQDSLLPWLSIVDNVQLKQHLTHSKNKSSEQQAIELLELVNMEQHLHKAIYQLSGGQRQRVALARTLMQDADIVLMDEPFSALDALNRLKLQNLAAKLLANKTVFLVTHDPEEAIRLSNIIYLLRYDLEQSRVNLSSPINLPKSTLPHDLQQHNLWEIKEHLLKQLLLGSE